MRCCVPFCQNTHDNASKSAGKGKDERVTFHGFPNKTYLRSAWLRALGIQDIQMPKSAVVCSQHFLDDDFYKTDSGLRQIGASAIPSSVQVCMICLDTKSKLFLVSKHKLEESLEKLTGHPLCDLGNLKQTICVQCARRLINFSQFRDMSLRARSLLMELVEKQDLITQQHIKMINSAKHQRKCNLVMTNLGPDHCNLYIVENSDDFKQRQIEKTGEEFECVVKEEVESVMKVKSEVSDQYTEMLESKPLKKGLCKPLLEPAASSSSVPEQGSGTQYPVKYESVTFGCNLCLEDFSQEHEYNVHMNMHFQDGDVSGGCEPVCKSPVTENSSHNFGHAHAMQKLECNLPSTKLFSEVKTRQNIDASSATYIFTTDGEDTINKPNGVFDSYNQTSESKNKTNKLKNCAMKLCHTFKEPKKLQNSIKPSYNISIDTNPIKLCQPVQTLQIESDCLTNDMLSNTPEPDTQCLEQNGFTCDVCGVMFKHKNVFVEHIQTHSQVKLFICKFCPYKCKQSSILVRHMLTHTGEKPYSCKLCNYRSAQNGHLMRHMVTHTSEKPYSCKLCNYKCASNGNLVRHMRSHTNEPYSCELCNHRCARKSMLAKHMLTHRSEKPYSCNLCSYKASNKVNLVLHTRTHTGEKPYSCELCDYKCAQKSTLLRHTRTHTGEKPYSCERCNYKCTQKSMLIRHMVTHTGERPYSCKLCNYKGAYKNNLMTHMKTHTGEKPYSCNQCNYKCVRKSHLVRHTRTHTGEKPYSCELCNYKCTHKRIHVKHMLTHTG